ncbi:dynein associated protein-domain-containing protein [Elsinoe ampelina]|uniref:Dynein associated protein-domain-containing protein n=1 Tax=Elsinoe ampelina TaxID=302913 RepID=A0A6A6GHB8_9PEZI|nr:dynein associated protein-domain-containing protein [Elsinoe ampelina]
MSNLNPSVGQKVQLNDGRTAIIRFKGATAFAPGEWIGVELEEASGKNDGSVQGDRYFDCEDKHGMFLRSTGIGKVLDTAKSTSRASLANGAAAKSRTSTVGLPGKTRPTAVNGRTRESSVASPTPARASVGRMSSLKSPLTSPTKQLGTAGSSGSSRTSTPSVVRGASTAAKSRTSLAPSASAAGRRTSTVPAAVSARSSARPSIGGPGLRGLPSRGTTTATRGARITPGQRLSTHSQTTTTSRASTEDRELSSDGRSPVLSPGSDNRAPSEGPVEEEDEEEGQETPAKEDVDATPRAVRTAPSQTTGPSRTPSMQSLSPTMSSASVRPGQGRTAANSSREIEDLQTKLRVLEKRRLEDREKLRTLERIQQERDRFESIIQKLQQKYQPQQQELADLKKQIKESEERFADIENIQADHDAELENATLDREMAEEQYETAKAELAALREKYEEMELEVEVLREENQELGQEMSPEERTSQGWLQLERSNERYREALIRLRDVTQEQEAELKQQIVGLEKDLEQFSGINEEADDLKVKLLESEAAIGDLKQQLELAQGGEEMLEELTERNMTLQERIEDLNATVEDLENLRELSDELEVNHIEAEKQMQEEIDFKDSIIGEQLRRSQEQQKAIDDYEMTVARFREAFRSLQADLEDMRASKQITDTEAEDLNSKSKALMDLNMKLQSSAAKTQIKTLDLELQRLEAEEAAQHLAIVRLFLPESYQADRDSVLALLRFKRIAFKADLLHGLIKERVSEQVGDDLFPGCSALDRLAWVQAMSTRFVKAINACAADDFNKFEGALYELEPVERGLNNYVEMFKNEDLQLKRINEEVERSIAVMTHLASTLLQDSPAAVADEILMQTTLLQTHLENTAMALGLCKSFVEARSASSPQTNGVNHDDSASEDGNAPQPSFGPFFERVDSLVSQTRSAKVLATKIHRELSDLSSRNLTLPANSLPSFQSSTTLAATIASFAHAAGQSLTSLTANADHESLSPRTVVPILTQTATRIFTLPQPETSPLSTLHTRLTSLTESLSSLYTQSTDLSTTIEFFLPPPPWVYRSQTLKASAAASSDASKEIIRLNEILSERNLLVRTKEKDLDEQGLRIEMLEARMDEAKKRAGRVEELEGKMVEMEAERKKWRSEVERWEKEGRRLREERDEMRRKVEEGKGRERDVGEEVVGRRAKVELEWRRVQVEGLKGIVRHLSKRTGGGQDLDWLGQGLGRARNEEGERLAVLEREARDVMRQLLEMSVGAEMVDLRRQGKDRLKWRPVRETSAWVVGKRKEDYEAWNEWRASVVRRAEGLGRGRGGGPGRDTVG